MNHWEIDMAMFLVGPPEEISGVSERHWTGLSKAESLQSGVTIPRCGNHEHGQACSSMSEAKLESLSLVVVAIVRGRGEVG